VSGPAERVERVILAAFADDHEPSPSEVAMELCDEDVANGDYEGCSGELDLAASEYMALASRALGKPS
jgi:hypothetical protein